MYKKWGKRVFDFVVALGILIAIMPIIGLLWIVVRVKLGAPAFFIQMRSGKSGEVFHILKYRTMIDARDAHGKLLPDRERLTSFGRFLRSTSLDELPELWNVLKGEMSLVGPRPLLVRYLNRYTLEQRRRHNVRPGITGWAQVNGRNALSWEEKFAYDIWYVDNLSFRLDIKVLWITIVKIFKRENISSQTHVTMDEFLGQ